MDYLLKDIEENYFYGIDFDNGIITSLKRFDNDNKDIINAYNESERLDTFALIKSLYIEYYILRFNLSKAKSKDDVALLFKDFRSRNGVALAIFTDDLMKKIGRSIDIEKSSKIFEVFDSVGDALMYIYKLCKDEFIDVSKESNYVDEKLLKKNAIHAYLKLVQDNFKPRSTEYDIAMKEYQNMLKIINDSSLEEFVDIFKRSYYEVLRDIENNDIKGNVK